MQITFDPLNHEERAAVQAFLVAPFFPAGPDTRSLDDQPAPAAEPLEVRIAREHSETHIAALMESIGERLAPGVTVSETDDEQPPAFSPAEEVFKPDPAVAAAFAPDASASDMPALGGDDEDQVGGDDEDQVGENGHAPTGDLDSAGLPWDARIHASTRTKLKADGRWKPKRGVEAATVATVEAELRALMAIPAPAAAPVPPPPPPAAPLPPAGAVAPAAPASAPVPPPPPAAPAVAGAPQTFAQFMQWLGPKLTAGTLARETVLEAAKAEGLPSVEKLVSRPDLIPLVYARLQP